LTVYRLSLFILCRCIMFSLSAFGIMDDLEICGSVARCSALASDRQRGFIGDFIQLLR